MIVSASKNTANSSSASFNTDSDELGSFSINLSNYMTKSNPVLEKDLYMKEGVSINMNGKLQTVPFSDEQKASVELSTTKLSNMTFEEDETKFMGNLNLANSTLNLATDAINIINITGLTSKLSEIDDNLSAITLNDVDISLNKYNIQLNANNIAQNGLNIAENTDDITTNNTFCISNKAEIDDNLTLLNSTIDDVAINLSNINSNATGISQNVLNISNNLALISSNTTDISQLNTDLANSNVLIADNTTNITLNNTLSLANKSDISQNTYDIAQNKTLHEDLQFEVDTNLSLLNGTIMNVTDNYDLINTNITSISTNATDIVTANNNITNINTELSTVNSNITTNTTNISTNQGNIAIHTADIAILNTTMLTKQPNITANARVGAHLIGNGDVSNLKMSTLSDINTNETVQTQINRLTTDISIIDGLQDLDLVSIPALQTNVSNLQTQQITNTNLLSLHTTLINDISSNLLTLDQLQDVDLTNIPVIQSDIVSNKSRLVDLETFETTQGTTNASFQNQINTKQPTIQNNDLTIAYVSGLQSDLNTKATNTANNLNSINTLNTNVSALVSADAIHDTQISNLQSADTTLQNNINTKQNEINSGTKLDSSLVFDTGMNDTVSTILDTLDSNITVLNDTKQPNITTLAKLNSSLLNRNDNLQYVDVGSSIQSSLNSINSNITLLQGTDSTIIDDIQFNFEAVDVSLNAMQSDITGNANAIATIQSLQSGDVSSFNSINASITNLQSSKHDLIDMNNKLNSSLLNRDDSLQYVDINSSLATSLTGLQTNIDTKQAVIDTNNKVSIQNVDVTSSNIQYADYPSSISAKMTTLDTSISTLSATDVSQATTNTSVTNSINTINSTLTSNASDITALQSYDTAQTAINTTHTNNIATNATGISDNLTSINTINSDITTLQSSTTALEAYDTAQTATNSSVQTSLNTLQSNIDAKQNKIESHSTLTYDTATNIITHTYDEDNLFVNTLDDTALMELDLTINNVANNKTYNQRVIIDALEHKSYINVLKINGSVVEIKHLGGNTSINLSPIAGYSLIEQQLSLSRVNNEWYAQSNIELFYNSESNVVYDGTPPIITLTGSSTISHEINTTYTEPGYSASDDPGTIDVTSDVVVTGDTVDTSVLGAVYNIYYDVTDANGNVATQKIRTINIVDTTNPVITLTTGEITISANSVYDSASAGASASDNSLEALTITVDESNLDVTTTGAYTVTFSTSDSTGNTHSINQIVNVSAPAMTLQYDNPSQDLFQLMNFYSNMNSQPKDTQANWTVTSGDAWKQGDYQVYATSFRGNSNPTNNKHFLEVFRGKLYSQDNKFFEFRLTAHQWLHETYGLVSGSSNAWVSAGSYQSFTPYNCTGGNLEFTTPGCQTGEYIEVSVPFHVKPSRFTVGGSLVMPHKFQIVATLDNGANWDILGYITPASALGNFHLDLSLASDFTGYNKFRLILYQNGNSGRAFFDKFQMFGKVYAF